MEELEVTEVGADKGTVVFPQLSGLNWPSYLLQAWQTLHELGVPEENLRLLPEMGHFAAPEISSQEPPGPVYDSLSERLVVHRVDPEEVRPRLTVSVRTDIVDYFVPDGEQGEGERCESREVGRLAHFVPPLLAGLPGVPRPQPPQSPLEDLTRQVCAAYPELMQALPTEIRVLLEAGADDILAVLASDFAEAYAEHLAKLVQQATQRVAEPERTACREAWLMMAAKLPPRGIDGLEAAARPAAMVVLERWAFLLYGPEAAAEDDAWTALTLQERSDQSAMLRAMLAALSYETARERERIVRDLMEITTTEALLATAVADSLSGIGWIHGRISDMRAAGTGRADGWFLSVTGGRSSRSLLEARLEEWAGSGGVLGVGLTPDRQTLDISELDPAQLMQLWSLAAWRRESADPFILLETAAQRLIHPEVVVRPRRYVPAFSRPGTLLAQLNSTAILGGAALLQYPGVVLEMPLSDDDDDAGKARATLAALIRLFLPVCCRVEVLWRESEARLDRPTYLKHEFQTGARLSSWAEDEDDVAAGDPMTL